MRLCFSRRVAVQSEGCRGQFASGAEEERREQRRATRLTAGQPRPLLAFSLRLLARHIASPNSRACSIIDECVASVSCCCAESCARHLLTLTRAALCRCCCSEHPLARLQLLSASPFVASPPSSPLTHRSDDPPSRRRVAQASALPAEAAARADGSADRRRHVRRRQGGREGGSHRLLGQVRKQRAARVLWEMMHS